MEQHEGHVPSHLGQLTYADLTDTRQFSFPMEMDAWGVSRAPFSAHIARLSAELAANGYSLDIKPWMAAGWNDCTFVVEDRVILLDREGDSRLAAMESAWKRRRAKALIRGVSPINDLLRAVRQLLITDLGKSIVMTRPGPDGKVIIAISFIGTTQKYFDWFSNFKMHQNTGMHHGFSELAKGFDGQSSRIVLPKLADVLGEASFTLADAILEAQKPDSRFIFWISGHSQGGAIVQTYTHLLLSQGVPHEAIRGYTFAAPTVAAGDGSLDPKAYPVYNIINADDLVPRIGAHVRLGVDHIYYPTNAFRTKYYGVEKEQQEAFDRVRFMGGQVQTTEQALSWIIALLHIMRDGDEAAEGMFSQLLPHMGMLRKLNLSVSEVAEFLEGKIANQLVALGNTGPDEQMCAQYEASLRTMMGEFDAKTIVAALGKVMIAPHRMSVDKHDEDDVSPYIAIVRRYLGECVQAVWLPERPPRCISARGQLLMPQPRGQKAIDAEAAALPAPDDDSPNGGDNITQA